MTDTVPNALIDGIPCHAPCGLVGGRCGNCGPCKAAEALRTQQDDYRTLHDAAKELILRMKVIHANAAYKSVWTDVMIHGRPYSGPTYEKELEALAEAVGLVQETAL